METPGRPAAGPAGGEAPVHLASKPSSAAPSQRESALGAKRDTSVFRVEELAKKDVSQEKKALNRSRGFAWWFFRLLFARPGKKETALA